MRLLSGALVVLVSVLMMPPEVVAQRPEQGSLRYAITRVDLAYLRDHPLHPPLRDVADQAVAELVEVDRVLFAPDAAPQSERGQRRRRVRLAVDELGLRFPAQLDASAVAAISRAVVRTFGDLGIGAVRVAPDPEQIGPTGLDLRVARTGPLRLIIDTARVTSLRTVAAGERFEDGAVNIPEHARWRQGSPVQPAEEADGDEVGESDAGDDRRRTPRTSAPMPTGAPDPRRDLLLIDELDRFLARANRRPGRFARALVSSADDPAGELALDIVVSEAKPWLVYAQLSDTGTEATGELRFRLGFLNDQLTGNDDSLSLSYVTGEADADPDFQALAGSYEAPIGSSDRFRWRVFGSWSEFSAAELGRDDDAFLGETGVVGGAVIANVAQFGELFVDVEAGVRFEDIETTNRPAFLEGDEELLIGSLGVTIERITLTDELLAGVRAEGARGSLTGADEFGLTELGRLNPSEDWLILTADAAYSFYLEPLLDREAWEDPTTPETSTLAHEVALSASAQWAFDHRLIPQQQGVLGGLYSVRGYPESVIAGDSIVRASAEYRFHLPRTFGVRPDPRATPLFGRPFRVAPQQVYGSPDWDLVLKAFVDAGRVVQSDRLPFEENQTLSSVGVGAEFVLRNNLRARLDYAIPTSTVDNGGRTEGEAGDGELHFAVTVSY
jgi:hemolysin activation/secretion protein